MSLREQGENLDFIYSRSPRKKKRVDVVKKYVKNFDSIYDMEKNNRNRSDGMTSEHSKPTSPGSTIASGMKIYIHSPKNSNFRTSNNNSQLVSHSPPVFKF